MERTDIAGFIEGMKEAFPHISTPQGAGCYWDNDLGLATMGENQCSQPASPSGFGYGRTDLGFFSYGGGLTQVT